ncbi:MAG: PEGA domain-containing protein [Bacteroidales bacterium]|nr:PEGA domain-containing protein [Bacteroidales bacterium]
MRRFFILFFSVFLLSLNANAQISVKQGSFKEVEGFVNIDDKQYDDNGTSYAVIKVRTENITDKERRDLSFDGGAGTSFELEYKDGEVWVYITYLVSQLKITHPEFGSVSFEIPVEMKPKCGYEMLLVNKIEAVESGWGTISVVTKPEDGATITINDNVLKVKTPYTNTYMPVGEYKITVTKDHYQPVTKVIFLKNGDNQTVEIDMMPICGKINITTNTTGAKVYIDNQEIGVTPLKNKDVIVGMHELKIEKEGMITMYKYFDSEADKVITFNEILVSCPEGAINGVFSIGKSHFLISTGNLQYNASTKTWRFAENQWDFIGKDNENISPKYNGWIDLFGWGTGNNPTMTSKKTEDYNKYVDWANNTISNGRMPGWKTVSDHVWHCMLFDKDTYSGVVFVKANVNGVNGIVILPDHWKSDTYSFQEVNNAKAKYNSNVISLSDWETIFAANGAAFLPAAGRRDGTLVRECGGNGNYWAPGSFMTESFYMVFSGDGITTTVRGKDGMGASVRLVYPADDLLAKGTYSTVAQFGRLVVNSEPSGATVFIDSKNYGVTPLEISYFPKGEYEMILEKEGFKLLTKKFELQKDQTLTLDETLEKNKGIVMDASFSVSPTEKVRFSHGNLQYDVATRKWLFADNQWDVIGISNANKKAADNGRRDLFGWGTGNNPMNTSINGTDYPTFKDWGNNTISNSTDKSIKWRTLSREEWVYLLEKRETNSGIRYAIAVVNGVSGVILLPDSWNPKTYKLKNTNKPEAKMYKNDISKDDWENVLEPNGAIFLPAAGSRDISYWGREKSFRLWDPYYACMYWSSTGDGGERAACICFALRNEALVYSEGFQQRPIGCSVRLVCPVK